MIASLTDQDRRVLARLVALGRICDTSGVLLDEWLDLTKPSTLAPLLERVCRALPTP